MKLQLLTDASSVISFQPQKKPDNPPTTATPASHFLPTLCLNCVCPCLLVFFFPPRKQKHLPGRLHACRDLIPDPVLAGCKELSELCGSWRCWGGGDHYRSTLSTSGFIAPGRSETIRGGNMTPLPGVSFSLPVLLGPRSLFFPFPFSFFLFLFYFFNHNSTDMNRSVASET